MAIPALIHPERLWWLLLLPVIWWLAQPPRPRSALLTAHLRQWLHARNALRRRPVRHRRLRTWLLLSAVVLAVLAHGEPHLAGTTGPDRLAVLLDGSASMAAREDDGSNAWQRALTRLRRELPLVPPHVEVRLLVLGTRIEMRQGLAARSLLDLTLPGGAAGVDLGTIATGLAADPRTVLWTLTDGQGPTLPPSGALTVLGTVRDNWAIDEVAVTDHWPLPQLSLSVGLRSCSGRMAEAQLAVTGAVAAVPPQTVVLAPGEHQHVVLSLSRTAAGGLLAVSLRTEGDALAADDHWACRLPPLPAPRIAVLCDAEAGPAIHAAAAALAVEVSGTVVAAGPGEDAGFLLVEGGAVDLEPGAVRSLCFGTRLGNAGPAVPWLEPVVLDWDRADPLTAGLDLSELRIAQAWRGILPPGNVLVTGQVQGAAAEPLLVVVERDGAASLHAAFRLQDSNLPLLAAFPQLLRRSLLRAYGQTANIIADSPDVAAGESDLRQRGGGPDRELPAFAMPGSGLSAVCVLLALLALCLRGWLR